MTRETTSSELHDAYIDYHVWGIHAALGHESDGSDHYELTHIENGEAEIILPEGTIGKGESDLGFNGEDCLYHIKAVTSKEDKTVVTLSFPRCPFLSGDLSRLQ